ncbi:hypothetical protein PILCRDRAFT_650763 [Piloderma croceum F 1598]|uniref:Uncharacterized protein n=1 Tax=Piloderma croceum (strain F 1598) TaxID=765440 RepID=A0A0C3AQU1_PILCF|nr:hypothetical protein PILCRDRAFT_650763 [Piloderma croceum F 1598]
MSWEFLADEKAGEEAVRITGTIVSMGSGEEVLEVIFIFGRHPGCKSIPITNAQIMGPSPNFLPSSSSDTNARNLHPPLRHNSPPFNENAPTTHYAHSSDFRLSNEDMWCGLGPRGKVGRPSKDKG